MAHGDTGSAKISIKPVYDIAVGSKDSFLPFELSKAMHTFTLSNAVISMPTTILDSITAYQIANLIPSLVQKQDTIGGYTFGDDTDLETIFFLKPNASFEITQCFIQAAFATNLSARSSNGVTFDSVEMQVRKYLGTSLENYEVIASVKQNTGFAQQVTTDAADIWIFQAQFSGASIKASDTIGIYFKCNNTKVATCTYQSMMLPLFSFTVTDVTKTWYQSGLANHALPSFDNAAPAFKDAISGYPIDVFGSPQL